MRDIEDLQRQLQSIEALVADFQKALQQKGSELETLRAKVSHHSKLASVPRPSPLHM